MHKAFVFIILLPIFMAAQVSLKTPSKSEPKSMPKQTPKQIHTSALVIDTHADTTQRFLDEKFDMAAPAAGDIGHLDFAKAKAGNLAAEFFSIWVDPVKWKGQYAHRTVALIDSVYQQAERHPDKMMMAFSPADIQKAHKTGKLAALLGVEGGHSIENDMGLLRMYYKLGVRYMTLTWSNTNEWADSSGDIDDPQVEHHKGLTLFGREIVREMNRLGMMVDVSHVSDRTFFDALRLSRAPVIASHSSARALTDHPRNMTDDMLRQVKINGGVVMVNFYSGFVDSDFRKAQSAVDTERKKAQEVFDTKYKDADSVEIAKAQVAFDYEWSRKIPRPPLKSLIDHIDHVAKIAGVDHTGLGSDFDGVSYFTPDGMDSAADLPKITEELMKRGYSATDMKKILGGNLLRVFKEVERMSHQIQREEPMPLLKRQPTQ
jgi:membrane dipeptidase